MRTNITRSLTRGDDFLPHWNHRHRRWYCRATIRSPVYPTCRQANRDDVYSSRSLIYLDERYGRVNVTRSFGDAHQHSLDWHGSVRQSIGRLVVG